ncbi:helix-turn-helix domain-containing protein [Sphingomonas sp. Leaf4]|uniref:helix-turn-helix domain-containing protein n=1 Tax=Sphingomonas sp. Leaf4 TaxID=2876553 RepID=UPI001E2F661B|nr:helix-turn-helix domain-containing protein [Sphingomonas sp. Leaf4]
MYLDEHCGAPVRPPVGERWHLPGDARILIRVGDGRAWAQVGALPPAPLPTLALVGPTSKPLRIMADGAQDVVVVPLGPAEWAQVLPLSAAAVANRISPFDPLRAGALARDLSAAIRPAMPAAEIARHARAVLIRRCDAAAAPGDPLVPRLQAAIDRDEAANAGRIAETLGLSREALGRTALRHFGFSTKSLLMRRRFLRALDRFREAGLTTAAQEGGYRSVPHLLRDAHLFLGMTPRRYVEQAIAG